MQNEKIEAQVGVVGSILLDSNRLRSVCEKFSMTPDWFEEPYKQIVNAITEMWLSQEPVDLLTVIEKMRLRGTLDRIGGARVVESCVDATPTAANAEHYLVLLRGHGVRAGIMKTMQSLAKRMRTDDPELIVTAAATEFRDVLTKFSIKKEKTAAEVYADVLSDWRKAHEDQMNGIRPNVGLHMPWWRLTKLYGGLKPGLHLLCAMPSAGKSTMEALVRHHALRDGKKTLTIELDMNPKGLLKRDLARLSAVSLKKFDFGYARKDQLDQAAAVAESMSKLPQKFIFSTSDIDSICAQAYEMKMQEGLDLITIDAGQMLTMNHKGEENMAQESKTLSEKLKRMAHQLDCPVYCLLHLKKPENKKIATAPPTLDDIWGGKYWENNAASAAMLYRNETVWKLWLENALERYKEEKETRPTCQKREFIPDRPVIYDLAKNQNGEVGQVNFLMKPRYFQFRIANDKFDEEPDDQFGIVDEKE